MTGLCESIYHSAMGVIQICNAIGIWSETAKSLHECKIVSIGALRDAHRRIARGMERSISQTNDCRQVFGLDTEFGLSYREVLEKTSCWTFFPFDTLTYMIKV